MGRLQNLTTLPKRAQHPALTSLCSTWDCFELLPPILGCEFACCGAKAVLLHGKTPVVRS